MKRSDNDCNGKTQTRGDVGDTGVTLNELGLIMQRRADWYDSSPTLRLSEEIKKI